jgi:hypothetical protein
MDHKIINMTTDLTNFKAKSFYDWMELIQSVKLAEIKNGYDFIENQINN